MQCPRRSSGLSIAQSPPLPACSIVSHPAQSARQSGVLLQILALAAVAARLVFHAVTGATFEDAYISLRYAENLATGQGLLYNPGERVFGASTPLYVLLLAGLHALGIPALAAARLLCIAADGLTTWLWSRWLLRQTGSWHGPALFAALFGLAPIMVQVGVSGMETSLALLCLSVALLADHAGRRWGTGVALGLLCLLRPDGTLAAATILGCAAWRERRVPWEAGLAAAAVVAPWTIWALGYYGTLIPHSIPAKAAAYNLHRAGALPNLLDTLAHLAPIRGPWWRLVLATVLAPALLAGLGVAARTPHWRPPAVLFGVWWLYLVLPGTLLFTWYYPPLLLPALVVAGLGARPALAGALRLARRCCAAAGPALRPAVAGCLSLALAAGLTEVTLRAARIQRAEAGVRRAVGLWLREHTPADALVAAEPIGYIGYYSRRRMLDEVGLVTPGMVPLNREGDGWFARMLQRYRPDYVVERPGYLLRNTTINSRVAMFRSRTERDTFLAEYVPVAAFTATEVPRHLLHDYRFVVYARRTPAEAERWSRGWLQLGSAARERRALRALTGPEAPAGHRAQGGSPPPRP